VVAISADFIMVENLFPGPSRAASLLFGVLSAANHPVGGDAEHTIDPRHLLRARRAAALPVRVN